MKHFGPIVWLDEPPQRREWSDCGPDPDPRPAAPVVTVKTECRHTIRDSAYSHQARMRHGLTTGEFGELHDTLQKASKQLEQGLAQRPFPPSWFLPMSDYWYDRLVKRTPREQFIDALNAFGSQMRQGESAQHARNKLIELFDKVGK